MAVVRCMVVLPYQSECRLTVTGQMSWHRDTDSACGQ